MLRLLAQREEGYEDIAALTGLERRRGAGQGRGRARRARQRREPPAQPPPSPRSRPRRRRPKPETEPTPPPTPAKSEGPVAKAGAEGAAAAKPAASGRSPRGRRAQLPEDKGAPRALIAGAAVVADPRPPARHRRARRRRRRLRLERGDDGERASPAGADHAAAAKSRPRRSSRRSTAATPPARPCSAAPAQNVVLLLRAEASTPSPKGQSYTVSLVRSATRAAAAGRDRGDRRRGSSPAASRSRPQVLGLLAGGFDDDGSLAGPRRRARARR